jgi:hypothetical protein
MTSIKYVPIYEITPQLIPMNDMYKNTKNHVYDRNLDNIDY